MNPDPWRWALLGVAGALGGAAVLAGANDAVAVPLAGGALLAVTGFATLSLVEQVRFHLPQVDRPDVDTLAALRRAFDEGALGRQRITQALLELERETLGRTGASGGDVIALRPESVNDAEFRQWVTARIEALEAMT